MSHKSYFPSANFKDICQAIFNAGQVYSRYSGPFFDTTNNDITCAPTIPCHATPCDPAENKLCHETDIDGIPTAFCSCTVGYHDLQNRDNSVLAVNTQTLTCENLDECSDRNLNMCDIVSQDCTDMVGSYTCECKTNYFTNPDLQTVSTEPCIECTGPGAVVVNDSCQCTATANTQLQSGMDNVCECQSGYEEYSAGTCSVITTTATTPTTTATSN